MGIHGSEDILAAHVGQADIANHQVGHMGRKARKRGPAASPPLDAPALKLKALLQGLSHDGIILHYADQSQRAPHSSFPHHRLLGIS